MAEADWHRQKAHDAERFGDPFPALVHLDSLVAAAPDDIGLRKRRADVEADLGRWAAAAADFGVVVKLGPNEADARASLAVLSARLGDLAGYRSHCNALLAMIRGTSMRGPVIVIVDLAALRPEGLDDPEALVKRLEPGKGRATSGFAFWSALGAAQYRAGHFEEARQSVRKSIAIYAGDGFVPFALDPKAPPGARPKIPPGARLEDVGPDRDDGTPHEWFLMALIEARLQHAEAATAWRAKAVRWLDRAIADRTSPEVLGGMDTAQERTMLRMSLPFGMASAARLSFEVKRRHVPTWRQLLALGFLRDELDAIMRSSGPRPVSDAPRSSQPQP